MALSPNVPTSFVPRPSAMSRRGFRFDFIGAFSFFCYLVLLGVVALAIGVFLYDRALTATLESKRSELADAKANIDAATAQSFVRLQSRLDSSTKLLSGHIAPTGFFSLLEKNLPTTVRFSNLNMTFGSGGGITVMGSGTAKSLNALAVASNNLAKSGVKEAIFSSIVVNKDSTATFSFSGKLDPKVVVFAPLEATSTQPSAPAATSSATEL